MVYSAEIYHGITVENVKKNREIAMIIWTIPIQLLL